MRRLLVGWLALSSACAGVATSSTDELTGAPPGDEASHESVDAALSGDGAVASGLDASAPAAVDSGALVDATIAPDASGDATSVDATIADASSVIDAGQSDAASADGAPSDADSAVVDAAFDAGGADATVTFAPGWTHLPGVGLPPGRVRAVVSDAKRTIVAAVEGYGVYSSSDLGATFTKLGAPALANDPPSLALTTLTLTSLGEPIVGMAQSGTGTGSSFIARLDSKAGKWVTASVTQSMNLGGYFPPAFRHDIDGALLSSWPFRNDVMRSTDDGTSWKNAFSVPNASHTPPLGPSATVKAVYGVGSHPSSGELLCGTEGDQWWHSTDRGASWSMIDQGGVSSLALEPGQNGFLVAFDKDGDVLFGTQGKPDGHFLVRWSIDGEIGPSDQGFPLWAMVGTATMPTVLRELVLTNEGDNYLAMPVNDGKGGAFPPDVYRAPDGVHWEKLSAPFVPELNALAPFDEASVVVGGGAASPGQVWIYTPKLDDHLPRVTTGAAKGAVLSAPLAGLTLSGAAKDPDGDPLTFTWHARGPGKVAFGAQASPTSTASFSAVGDYVLTLVADDGKRSAGASVIVHVQ